MTDQEIFEAQIQANPKDKTLRLVFADWLQDHDDQEYAEAMRVVTQILVIICADTSKPNKLGSSMRERVINFNRLAKMRLAKMMAKMSLLRPELKPMSIFASDINLIEYKVMGIQCPILPTSSAIIHNPTE